MRDGKGVVNMSNGDNYDGEFANNMRNGYGIMDYAEGDKYIGHFVNNKK